MKRRTVAIPLLAAVLGSGLTAAAMVAGGRGTGPLAQEQSLVALGNSGEMSANEIFERAAPGVVFIRARTVQPGTTAFQAEAGNDLTLSTGSGFVLDGDGRVLTNAHVVNGVTAVQVTFADLVRNIFVVALMFAVGFAVGWRVHTGIIPLIGAVLLVLLFGYALSWIFATVGLLVGDPETAQAAAFPVMAPLVFASNAFVPVASMPDWLQYWAEHQPVSAVITAVRDLTIGGPTTYDLTVAILWCVGILAVAAPIAVHRYRLAT